MSTDNMTGREFIDDTVAAYEALSQRIKALEEAARLQVTIETMTYMLERIAVAIEDINLTQQRRRHD